MRELITYSYEAFDGTVFIDEEECRKYEEDLLSRNLDLVMLDDNKQKLPINVDSFERATWVIVNKQADVDYLTELGENYGYSTPWNKTDGEVKMGVYHYDGYKNTWENYDDAIAKIMKDYAVLKAFRTE
jgi:hypothetical protein